MRSDIEESLSLEGPPDATVTIGGRVFQYYGGTSFYGLQSNPHVISALCEASLRYGTGTGTGRSEFTSPAIFDLESRISAVLSTERALYFSSGYMGNRMLLDSLVGTFERIYIDEAAHPSLCDAARTCGKDIRIEIFPHRDHARLEQLLKNGLKRGERPLVLSDGVFSSLGTIAPIPDYVRILCEYRGGSILLDDACGFGILGTSGRGTIEHFNYPYSAVNKTKSDFDDFEDASLHEPEEVIPIGIFSGISMSKAIGGFGGAIAGSETFIERLTERSKVLSGSSAPPPSIAAASACGLSLLFDDSRLRERLRENTVLLKSGLHKRGLCNDDSPIPIALLSLGSAVNMRRIRKELSQRGVLLTYLPRIAGLGSEGALRIAVFATHSPEMIEHLLDELARAA